MKLINAQNLDELPLDLTTIYLVISVRNKNEHIFV